MKNADRLLAIKGISAALSDEEWPVIDATLEAFGWPITDAWNDSKISYVLEMSRDASDDAVAELAAHLSVGPNVAPREESDSWEEGYVKLFISHLAAHTVFAHQVKSALAVYGISGFVAHDDIAPTAEWIVEIEKALFSADALVALINEGFAESEWTDQEVGVMMGRDRPILSVKLDAAPHGFLGKYQAIPGSEDPEGVARAVFEALASHEDTKRLMAYAVVYRTENATGHVDNQHIFKKMLPRIEYFDDEIAARLESAMDDSRYVAQAYNKVSVMEKLFQTWGYELDYDGQE